MKNLKIICLNCKWEGEENKIIVNKWGREFCPNCKNSDCLRDKNERGETMIAEYKWE